MLLEAMYGISPCSARRPVSAGKLKLPIDRTFPLDQAVAAQAHMKANQHFGKIALAM